MFKIQNIFVKLIYIYIYIHVQYILNYYNKLNFIHFHSLTCIGMCKFHVSTILSIHLTFLSKLSPSKFRSLANFALKASQSVSDVLHDLFLLWKWILICFTHSWNKKNSTQQEPIWQSPGQPNLGPPHIAFSQPYYSLILLTLCVDTYPTC